MSRAENGSTPAKRQSNQISLSPKEVRLCPRLFHCLVAGYWEPSVCHTIDCSHMERRFRNFPSLAKRCQAQVSYSDFELKDCCCWA